MRSLSGVFFATCLAAVTAGYALPVHADPSVFWFNDPVDPDDTVIVTGAELDKITGVRLSRVRNASENAATGNDLSRSVEIIQGNPLSLKFIVPKDFRPGVFKFELTHEKGSIVEKLNLPTVYWLQGDLGDAASTGGTLRILGRNMVRHEHARLRLTDGRQSAVEVASGAGDLWGASFTLPANLSAGTYRLRLSNGEGGPDEWIDAGALELRKPAPAYQAQRLDVRAFGAVGDGKTDSTAAVNAALAAAAAAPGGGTVYFAAGRYLLNAALTVPEGVRIAGERTDRVNLIWPDFPEPPRALISGRSRFALEDLTIYASNHGHIISGGFDGEAVLPDASDIAIRRVRIRASAFRGHMEPDALFARMTYLRKNFRDSLDSIRLSGKNLTVTDCDVVGSGRSLFLLKANYANIARNKFGNGRYGWYSISGSSNVIFEENSIFGADLQATGGGVNTLYRESTNSENILVRKNSFSAISGWDREAMTTDGPRGFYFGTVEPAGGKFMTLRDGLSQRVEGFNWIGAGVFVVDGKGFGQWARVAEINGKIAEKQQVSVGLDRELKVPLDGTSRITVIRMQRNYLVIDNTFEDTGVAAQIYGAALDHVFAGNVSTRTGGFFAMGMHYHHIQPDWHVQLLNNRITEGNVYRSGPNHHTFSGEAVIAVEGQTDQNSAGVVLTSATIVRGNRLDNDAHIEIKGFSATAPGVRDIVVEHNVVGASRTGMLVDRGVANIVARDNVISGK
jgi:hypothetical protein